jgi:predicted nuclease of predicted toxin-antitoxin system
VRLLIDECLSPGLVHIAQQSGHEAYHLAHIGRAGSEDWQIVELALARDMALVTNNASDFRRLYAAQELHPGLVILVPNVEREMQLRLFRAALARLRVIGELINKALEVGFDGDEVSFDEYEWPRGS